MIKFTYLFKTVATGYELDVPLRKIHKTGTAEKQPGSGRPRSVRAPERIDNAVCDIVLSQEDVPQTRRTLGRSWEKQHSASEQLAE